MQSHANNCYIQKLPKGILTLLVHVIWQCPAPHCLYTAVCTSSNWGTIACTQMENRAVGYIICTIYAVLYASWCKALWGRAHAHVYTCTDSDLQVRTYTHASTLYSARIRTQPFLATWSHICTCICARRDCDRCSYKHMHRENKSVPIYTYVYLQFEMKSQHCARVIKWLHLDTATI